MQGASGFEDLQKRIWKEIVRKGCEVASSALQTMLKVPLKMTGVVVAMVPIGKIPYLAGNPEQVVTGARMALSGDISGHMIFILTKESWDECKKLLLPLDLEQSLELEISAFAELTNVACSFFILSLADTTRLSIHFTPPEVMEDMTATVLEDTLVRLSEETDELLTVETSFSSQKIEVKGFLFFIPLLSSAKKITQRFLEVEPPAP